MLHNWIILQAETNKGWYSVDLNNLLLNSTMSNKQYSINTVNHLGTCLEKPHFHKTSFRVKKKIFATYDEKSDLLIVKFNTIDHDVFCKANKGVITPVPNKWEVQGWTQLTVSEVKDEVLEDLLNTAYTEVAK